MLTTHNITRSFDAQPVLCGVDLDVVEGEIVCLLGPSGCGKTTLLRIVAGLETADSGDVLLNGQSIMDQPVHTRDFGLMFQDFALFPHLNVQQNVEFGLRMKGLDKKKRQTRARETLDLVGMGGFESRDVAQLSGGERQRVALARSLAPNPRLLMLDEPLGSLDAALKERLVVDLCAIIKQIGLTALYVTHDQHEAFVVADRIALMNAGRFEQVATPMEIYHHPATIFTARFLGLENVVPVDSVSDHGAQTPLGAFTLAPQSDTPTETPIALLLHPDGITPDPNGAISGTISKSVFLGDAYRVDLQTDANIPLTFKLIARHHKPPHDGDTFRISIAPEYVLPLKS